MTDNTNKASRRRHHIFYKTTCLITGKYYYGMHSTNNINDDYLGSGKKLKYSILKHGPENHKREDIKTFTTRIELRDHEGQIVDEKLLKDPLCMNLIRGGNASFTPDKTFLSLSESAKKIHTGRKAYHNAETGEYRKFFPGTEPAGFIPGGRKKSEKTRERMRKAQQKNSSVLSTVTSGTSWFHNPTTGERKRLKPNDPTPDGFIKGRGKHSEQSRAKRSATMQRIMSSDKARQDISQRFQGHTWHHDPVTGDEHLIRDIDAPTGLVRGRHQLPRASHQPTPALERQ